ncbi:hypothetical protein BU15DRAFT_82408 [Melanogaster broomeanus]|nr:hypothetical protein BU15DRAFT_82408 [Melanogaster broomeanus]
MSLSYTLQYGYHTFVPESRTADTTIRRTSLWMSRDQNRSPRGRSLNDVLLTPTRPTSTTMNRRRPPRRSSTTQSEERMTLSPSQRAEYMRHGRCFKCGQEAHRVDNCPRRPRRTPTARPLSDNPMNLPRARRFLPRNDLPSNREDLFELVILTTTSALTQNQRIEELVPILHQLHHRRAEDISAVLADVTQLLERDLLALVGLSEAITRIPMTPPKTPTTKGPHVLAVLVQHSFAPAHVLNAFPLDTSISTVVGINVPCVTPPARDTLSRLCPLRVTEERPEPSTPLMVRPPADPTAAIAATDNDSFIGSSPCPSPRPTEENPDPDILIDSRLLTSPVLVSTVEEPRPDLIVTPSDEPSTSSSLAVEEVTHEERLPQEWSDVYPIEVLSPTPTRFAPVTPSPLREYFFEDSDTPAPQSPARSSPS